MRLPARYAMRRATTRWTSCKDTVDAVTRSPPAVRPTSTAKPVIAIPSQRYAASKTSSAGRRCGDGFFSARRCCISSPPHRVPATTCGRSRDGKRRRAAITMLRGSSAPRSRRGTPDPTGICSRTSERVSPGTAPERPDSGCDEMRMQSAPTVEGRSRSVFMQRIGVLTLVNVGKRRMTRERSLR